MLTKPLALALITLLGATHVDAKILDCAIKSGADTQGWIGDRTIINWDEAAGTAEVMDGIIFTYNKEKPIAATITVVSAAQTAFSWKVRTIDSGGQNASMFYRAVFYPADQKMIVMAKPGGYVQDFTARGKCTVK